MDFFEIFWGIVLRIFFEELFLRNFLGRNLLGGFFWRNSLGGILCLYCQSQLSYLNIEGIDLFVKILTKERRKEEFQPLEVRAQAHCT